MFCLVPPGITGKICLKSPPKTITLPPNGISFALGLVVPITSLKDRSKASKQCLCIIGASSHIIKLVLINKAARSVPAVIEQKESSLRLIGIPKREWAVRPPVRSKEAILKVCVTLNIYICGYNNKILLLH